MLDGQDSSSDNESASHVIDKEMSKLLEIEKREAIGEILKLNPTFKAPADYKPLLKEAKIPIPIKEHYGFNFINSILRTTKDNQKQLEKETGAKLRVFGRKMESRDEVEITTTLEKESNCAYEELYVQVTADTYEKVDAAVDLIGLLIAPVSVNAASGSTTLTAVSAENAEVVDISARTPGSLSSSAVNHGMTQPIVGPVAAGRQGHFQQYPGSLSSGPINMPSFAPQPVIGSGFSSMTQNPRFYSPRPQQPQFMQGPYGPQVQPISNSGLPRNIGLPGLQSTPTQSSDRTPPSVYQPTSAALSPVGLPVISSLHLSTPQTPSNEGSAEWSRPPMGMSLPLASGTPSFNVSQSNMPPQSPNLVIRSSSIPFPVTSTPSQLTAQLANPNSLSERSFNFNPTVTLASPRLLQPNSSDFTFQPQRPQHPASHFASQPGSHHGPRNIPLMMQNQIPQNPFVRLAMQASNPSPAAQVYLRPPVSNQFSGPRSQVSVDFAGRSTGPPAPPRHQTFAYPNSVPPAAMPQMQPRNFSLGPAGVNPSGPFPPRGNQMQFQPRNNMPMYPGRPSGAQQVYDPFSPTSLSFNPQLKGGLRPKVQRQESDPEYEDLMASVGVK
ncbi:hypothetical protein Leryth_003892 [Lithospermum erythrorhizon]|nr:hypothetical protein Leryth_003892 [Lithospermum erythrorhizon]